MKPAKILLALSLLANLALAVAWWWPRSAPAPSVASVATPAKAPTLTREQELAAALQADPDFAEAIKTGDPKRLREALTRAGFPPDYVRDMVTFLTGNSVSPEHLALLRLQASRPFWKISPGAEELALKNSSVSARPRVAISPRKRSAARFPRTRSKPRISSAVTGSCPTTRSPPWSASTPTPTKK